MQEKEKIENKDVPLTTKLKYAAGFAGHHLFSFIGAIASAVSVTSYVLSDFCDVDEDEDGTKKTTR